MDPVSSGEDLIIKTRKPYTISKQREPWTEEEHNRFLEALKLYGRAWQRIEEHIGTKTAVQIRSHAQKFFSKLEKEALAKGVPIGQAINIDIPPPRPKRKPSNPYPRKTSTTVTTTQVGAAVASSSCCKQVLDLEAEHLPEVDRGNGDQKATNLQNNQNDNCSEVLTLHLDANCSSISSVNGKSIQASAILSCTSREFVPSVKKTIKDNGTSNITIVKSSCTSNEQSVLGEKKDDSNCSSQTDKVQIIHDYPRPAAMRVVDGTLGICTTGIQVPVFHPLREVQGQPNIFDGTSISVTAENCNNASTSAPLLFPTFHSPYPPIGPDQEEYRSFLQASSTLSSFIVSTLLQNPAAHAAASFAATFWQYRDVERSAVSRILDQESFQSRQLNSGPSMAAVAAATVAAATAWWAANGMLPVCAPLHTAFNCPPALATQAPPMDGQVSVGKMHGDDNTDKKPPAVDHENSETLNAQDSASKSQTSSSSGSEEIEEAKANTGKETLDQEKAEADKELQDANKLKNRKQVDRSSCGSNTASSSEVETDGIKKHEKVKEDSKEVDPERPATDSSNRRSSRSTSSSSDSWKEVSEEGRLAFQALFSREVLPQSFSPPQILQKEQNTDDKTDDASTLDLNCHMWESSSGMQVADGTSEENKADDEKGLVRVGGLGQAKLMMAHRTGFKPYKRCSSEANENRMMVSTTSSQGEERCSKRKCLEAEAST